MKGTRPILAAVALILSLAATAQASRFGIDMYLRGGPGFLFGYRTGRFMPAIGLGLGFATGEEFRRHRDSTGAPESTWTYEHTSLNLYPEIGTRIYFDRSAIEPDTALQTYLWVGGFTSYYLRNTWIDGQPDTMRNRHDRWSPNGGARVGFGIEYQLRPRFAVKGEIGLTASYDTRLGEYTYGNGGLELYRDRWFSIGQYAALGVSYYWGN